MSKKLPVNICGSKIRYYRNFRELSQEKLAQKCQLAGWDIERETIAKIEHKIRQVRDVELKKISEVLRVPMEKLIE